MTKLFALADQLSGEDIRSIRKKLYLTQRDFADLVNVSVKTVERWEAGDKPVTGPVVTLVKLLTENPQIPDIYRIPPRQLPMRMWYMYRDEVCTIIDVDEGSRLVRVYNYTNRYPYRAFGREEHPSFEQYEEFLESRCFPRSRDKIKWELRELDVPYYDPFLIIEKTDGRMAEDDFWIRIER